VLTEIMGVSESLSDRRVTPSLTLPLAGGGEFLSEVDRGVGGGCVRINPRTLHSRRKILRGRKLKSKNIPRAVRPVR